MCSYLFSEDIPHSLGSFYCRHNRLSEAVPHLIDSLKINPEYHAAYLCLENIKASAIARWHFNMINDGRRNTAFKNAIEKAIITGYGQTVLDIGTGSGLLRY